MIKQKREPNYERLLESAIYSLQLSYNNYKNAIINYMNNTYYGNDGDFTIFGDQELYNSIIAEKKRAYERDLIVVNKMKKKKKKKQKGGKT